ncbi:L,D-transpeptidase [Polycladidibacter stylochi]|uniref:L,D-transpeptidase n=1 Tax=Polycladidibacter stylochi TaxID=1807766 RepID=UPI00082B695E|nr:L,D-transpeptidase [Pseudovibrio stylochi]
MKTCSRITFVLGGILSAAIGHSSAAEQARRLAPAPPIILSPDIPIYSQQQVERQSAILNRERKKRRTNDKQQRKVADRFLPKIIRIDTAQKAGTIYIDSPNRYLYYYLDTNRVIRYGIGIGRPGFEWSGQHKVTKKREWPDWNPPSEMLKRQPDLPRFVPGGPQNPLGARALYLGSTLYRIHGSNQPWTIGGAVSSGCIRMRNQDIIDLYERVSLGATVIVR